MDLMDNIIEKSLWLEQAKSMGALELMINANAFTSLIQLRDSQVVEFLQIVTKPKKSFKRLTQEKIKEERRRMMLNRHDSLSSLPENITVVVVEEQPLNQDDVYAKLLL